MLDSSPSGKDPIKHCSYMHVIEWSNGLGPTNLTYSIVDS